MSGSESGLAFCYIFIGGIEMKEQFEYYAVIPPDESYLDDFKLREGIGRTEGEFLKPASNTYEYKSRSMYTG